MNSGAYLGFPRGGQFGTIICDPPWPYRQRFRNGSHCPYPMMSEEEIFHLPVGDAAAEDAVMLLWTTNAHLALALECVKQYGFEQKTVLTWVKTDKRGRPIPGSGFWLRGSTEHALFCVRGKPKCPRSRILAGEKVALYTTALLAPRTRHSEKPGLSYAMMEELGTGARLDLFARRHHLGWQVWGNQIRPVVEPEASRALAPLGVPA